MNRILDQLNAQHPISRPDAVLSQLWSSFLITFVVISFITFGNLFKGEIEYSDLDNIAIFSFGMFCIMSFNFILIPRLFNVFFDEDKWVVWKQIIWILYQFFAVGTFNFILFTISGKSSFQLSLYIEFLSITIGSGLIPVTLWVLIEQNLLLKKNLKKAQLINQSIGLSTKITSNDIVTINPIHPSEPLNFERDKLLFFESDDNYVKIWYEEEDSTKQEMVRMTLSSVENQVENFSKIIKCHRAFIVNLDKVKSVKGNAQGLKLSFEKAQNTIPVSRNYVQKVRSSYS